jgi:membrane protein implicated in regulation of membrane protease activity
MTYLVLSIFAFAMPSPALNLILLPGYFLLVAPAPVLAVVGLSAGGWLVAEPNTAGFVLLIALYTTGAYFLAEFVERRLRERSRARAQSQPPEE